VDAVADAVADEEESKQATEDGCGGRGDIEAMSRCGELRPTLAARCDGLRPGWRRRRRTSEEKAVRASSQFSLSLSLSLSFRDRGGPASLNRFEVGASGGALRRRSVDPKDSAAQHGSRPRNSAGVGGAARRACVRPHSSLHLHHLLHSQRTCIHPRTLAQQQQQRMHHCYG
jgi:hypothetical protein